MENTSNRGANNFAYWLDIPSQVILNSRFAMVGTGFFILTAIGYIQKHEFG